MASNIEDRLIASLRYGAVNGDAHERSVCASQMREAAHEIQRLRKLLDAAIRAQAANDGE